MFLLTLGKNEGFRLISGLQSWLCATLSSNSSIFSRIHPSVLLILLIVASVIFVFTVCAGFQSYMNSDVIYRVIYMGHRTCRLNKYLDDSQ